jgi:hypothetical protein
MSREDAMSQLKIVQLPEDFADPPVFSIKNFLRSDEEESDEEVNDILFKFEGTARPQRSKPLLDEYLRECGLDPLKVLCFTTNSNLVYNTVKLVDKYLNWHFTKSQNVNVFHVQI